MQIYTLPHIGSVLYYSPSSPGYVNVKRAVQYSEMMSGAGRVQLTYSDPTYFMFQLTPPPVLLDPQGLLGTTVYIEVMSNGSATSKMSSLNVSKRE